MAARTTAVPQEAQSIAQAVGGGRTLAATMPRLILEAPRGARREFLAVPPIHVGRAGLARRLAPLGARRSSLCARAGMGGRAHRVDLARPFAVDGVRIEGRARQQAGTVADR